MPADHTEAVALAQQRLTQLQRQRIWARRAVRGQLWLLAGGVVMLSWQLAEGAEQGFATIFLEQAYLWIGLAIVYALYGMLLVGACLSLVKRSYQVEEACEHTIITTAQTLAMMRPWQPPPPRRPAELRRPVAFLDVSGMAEQH